MASTVGVVLLSSPRNSVVINPSSSSASGSNSVTLGTTTTSTCATRLPPPPYPGASRRHVLPPTPSPSPPPPSSVCPTTTTPTTTIATTTKLTAKEKRRGFHGGSIEDLLLESSRTAIGDSAEQSAGNSQVLLVFDGSVTDRTETVRDANADDCTDVKSPVDFFVKEVSSVTEIGGRTSLYILMKFMGCHLNFRNKKEY